MTYIDPRFLYGQRQDSFAEAPLDPRVGAIENYMQEQGDESRMPIYPPQNLRPREMDVEKWPPPDVPLSPNELEYQHGIQADQGQLVDDFLNELLAKMREAKEPYYGGEATQRRFFPRR